jgi:hypothetical protein
MLPLVGAQAGGRQNKRSRKKAPVLRLPSGRDVKRSITPYICFVTARRPALVEELKASAAAANPPG